MKNPEHNFASHHRWFCGRRMDKTAAALLVLMCAGQPVMAQTDALPPWQPGQLLNTLQTDAHDEVRKLLRRAQYAGALVWINKTLATHPRDPQMLFWQAYIFERQGQADAALPIYLALTQDYPELPEPFNNLGVLYAARGDYERAKQAFDLALRDNPSYAVAHENLGDVLVHMARQSYERATSADPKLRSPAQKIKLLQPALELSQSKP